jgi:hypothetical protein
MSTHFCPGLAWSVAPAAWRVDGDAPRLVAGEQVRRRPSSRLILAIDAGQRLSVGVVDDEASPRPSLVVESVRAQALPRLLMRH